MLVKLTTYWHCKSAPNRRFAEKKWHRRKQRQEQEQQLT